MYKLRAPITLALATSRGKVQCQIRQIKRLDKLLQSKQKERNNKGQSRN